MTSTRKNFKNILFKNNTLQLITNYKLMKWNYTDVMLFSALNTDEQDMDINVKKKWDMKGYYFNTFFYLCYP